MSQTEKYGRRNVSKMYGEINALRAAINSEGTPAIQGAWGAVEEHIDFAYRGAEVSALVAAAKRVTSFEDTVQDLAECGCDRCTAHLDLRGALAEIKGEKK